LLVGRGLPFFAAGGAGLALGVVVGTNFEGLRAAKRRAQQEYPC